MKLILTVLFLIYSQLNVYAAYVMQDGRLVKQDEAATMSVQEHYSAAMNAFEKKNWEELVHQGIIIVKNFPTTPFANEAYYYLGLGYFNLKDYDLANKEFSRYLKNQATPKHFEEAIEYKFSIAEKFNKGAKKHIFGWENLPKWLPAREDAVAIYDEVITALPHHELGAKALFGKANLLLKDEDYKASIEVFQTLIRRFAKHELAVESYLGIAGVYLTQCQAEYPNPDFLDLAEINLRKFRQDFPGDERVSVAENKLKEMQEIYALNLYETAQFFERTKKPHASVIYYNKIITNYPETKCAIDAQKRLEVLKTTSPSAFPSKAKTPSFEKTLEMVKPSFVVENTQESKATEQSPSESSNLQQ